MGKPSWISFSLFWIQFEVGEYLTFGIFKIDIYGHVFAIIDLDVRGCCGNLALFGLAPMYWTRESEE